jgi:hypothetical protein
MFTMAFIQYVRVEDVSTGHQYDVVDTAVDPKAHKVLADYPVNNTGYPRPAKHRINIKAAKVANTTKEK